MTSLSDCISIEHLGVLLETLSLKNDSDLIPRRIFPSGLEAGKANLIICQETDLFTTLLSLYMHSPKEPLPSLSEVQLCSNTTSKEEIELFLRRAIMINSRAGIICFVADMQLYLLFF